MLHLHHALFWLICSLSFRLCSHVADGLSRVSSISIFRMDEPRVQGLLTQTFRPLWLLLNFRQLIRHPPDFRDFTSSLTRSIMRFHCTMHKTIIFCFFSARAASDRRAWTSAREVDSGLMNRRTSMDWRLDVAIYFAAQKSDPPSAWRTAVNFRFRLTDSSTAGSGFYS